MKEIDLKKLENPVWQSLSETHQNFCVDYGNVKFYHPDVCAFGSIKNDGDDISDALHEYSKLRNDFFLLTNNKTPIFKSDSIVLSKKIEGCQMVLKNLPEIEITEEILPLDEKYIDEIYNLIWLVMPKYYQKRSFEMGNFFGIFKNNQLVAITGQRMQCDDWTEISAVVTHPDYTRRGLARQLVIHTSIEIIKDGKLPILHTENENPAIKLYEKLGFELSRDMSLWYYTKK